MCGYTQYDLNIFCGVERVRAAFFVACKQNFSAIFYKQVFSKVRLLYFQFTNLRQFILS